MMQSIILCFKIFVFEEKLFINGWSRESPGLTIQEYIDQGMMSEYGVRCRECGADVWTIHHFFMAPAFLIFNATHCMHWENGCPKPDLNITISVNEDIFHYTLKEICYHGSSHFTSRFISNDNKV